MLFQVHRKGPWAFFSFGKSQLGVDCSQTQASWVHLQKWLTWTNKELHSIFRNNELHLQILTSSIRNIQAIKTEISEIWTDLEQDIARTV